MLRKHRKFFAKVGKTTLPERKKKLAIAISFSNQLRLFWEKKTSGCTKCAAVRYAVPAKLAFAGAILPCRLG